MADWRVGSSSESACRSLRSQIQACSQISRAVGVRVLCGGRPGSSYTSDFTPDGLRFDSSAARRMRARTSSRFAAISLADIDKDMMANSVSEQRGKLARYAGRLNARCRAGRVPSLILMTDDTLDADWMEAVRALPARSALILRRRDARVRAADAKLLRPLCREKRLSLLIADDIDLASRCGADGVHVPEAKAHLIGRARHLNPNWIVTTSAHDAAALVAAERHAADAVLVSPVFPTRSHAGAGHLGVTVLASLVGQSPLPVIALGGITAENVLLLQAVPLAGIALIRGWLG